LELSETEESDIYSITLSDIAIGSSISFKFGINNSENGREEFPDSDRLRVFRLMENNNQVLNKYAQLGSSITALNEEKINENTFSFYPNPTQGDIHIVLKNLKYVGSNYKLIDGMGKVRSEGRLENERTLIDIQDLNEGLYFLQISGEGKIVNQKVLVID
jgi:hypothetical protein